MPNKGPLDLMDQLFSGAAVPVSPACRQAGSQMLLAYVIPWWQAPGRIAEDWAKSGRYVFSTLFLAGLFLKSVPRAEHQGRRLIITAVLIHLLLLHARVVVFGEVSPRYAVIPAALCIPWAAAAFVTILATIAGCLPRPTHARVFAVWAAGLVLALTPLVYYLARPVNHGKEHYRTAGLWLRENAGPNDIILAHEHLEQLLFYAGRVYPDETWLKSRRADAVEQIRGIINQHRPDWLVEVENTHRGKIDEDQYFGELLRGEIPQLMLVHTAGPRDRRAYIFRIVHTPTATQQTEDRRHGR